MNGLRTTGIKLRAWSAAGGRRYDRDSDVSGSEALGAECWDLMSTLVERLYDPDEQVGWGRAAMLGAGEKQEREGGI
jgi:hypothetical protein